MTALETRLSELSGTALVHETSVLPKKKHIRIETGFTFPDGASIELYVPADLLKDTQAIKLTDFGNAFAWLRQLNIETKNPRRRKLIQSVLDRYKVQDSNGNLECVVRPEEVDIGIVRLAQASLRISDIYYTQRFVSRARFVDELDNVFSEMGLDYETEANLPGLTSTAVVVDFKVRGVNAESAVMGLGSELKYTHTAKARAEHVLRTFVELAESWPGQRVAALDDRASVYEVADLALIGRFADIVPFSDSASLGTILRAA